MSTGSVEDGRPTDIMRCDFKIPDDSEIVASIMANELALPLLESPLSALLIATSTLPFLKGMIVGAVDSGRISAVEVGYVGDLRLWASWRGVGVFTNTGTIYNLWRTVNLRLANDRQLSQLSMVPFWLSDNPEQSGTGRFIDLKACALARREGRPINQPSIIDQEVTEHLERYTAMVIMQS